jgi:hypothetical protein
MKMRPPSQTWRAGIRIALLTLVWFGCAGGSALAQHSEGDIRRQLEEVYGRPEFSPNVQQTLFARVVEQLLRFLAWLGGLYATAPVLYWLLLTLCTVLLLALIAHILWTVRSAFFVSRGHRRAHEQAAKRARVSRTFWEEALRCAGAGDFTEAIRFLFLSMVYRYDESGRVSFPRAYTNREYLALFHDRPAVQSDLAVFVDALDDHWYGQRPAAEPQYARCLLLYENLLS